MRTRRTRAAPTTTALLALLAQLPLGACGLSGLGDTAPRPEDLDFEGILRSVSGRWTGFNVVTTSGPPPNTLRLVFVLTQAPDGGVTGTGTMQEAGAPGPVPITVTGSYRRPTLSLTFDGMVWAGRAVRGTISDRYESIGGVIGRLTLTAADATETTLEVLLTEDR